jgi:hypothetical protein
MNMYIVFCIHLNALATFSNALSFFGINACLWVWMG